MEKVSFTKLSVLGHRHAFDGTSPLSLVPQSIQAHAP